MVGGFGGTPMDFAITFWARPGELAVFYVHMRVGKAELMAAGSPLGGTVSETLFGK